MWFVQAIVCLLKAVRDNESVDLLYCGGCAESSDAFRQWGAKEAMDIIPTTNNRHPRPFTRMTSIGAQNVSC